MEPEELARAVAETVEKAQARVGPNSIGAQQYHTEGEPQKFEVIDVDTMFEMFEEEALDIINYGVMLSIKIARMRDAWRAADKIIQAYEETANEVRSDRTPEASAEAPGVGLPLGPTSFTDEL